MTTRTPARAAVLSSVAVRLFLLVLLRLPGGTLNTVRDYSTTASWNWNTTGLAAGTYQVVVRARNAGSTKSYEAYQSISYVLTPP